MQGVGFRWFVRERARRLGLAGWVRNEPDGSVSVAAEGAPEAVSILLEALRKGPEGSRVDEVEERTDLPDEVLRTPFGVLR